MRVHDWLAEDLEVSLARQAHIAHGGSGRRGEDDEQPLPYGEAASDAMWQLRTALVSWILVLLSEPPPPGPTCISCTHGSCRAITQRSEPEETLPAMAEWLIDRVERIRHHPDGHRAVEGICGAVREAQRAIDRPPDLQYAGPCGNELDDGEVCYKDLYARPDHRVVTCRCGATWRVEERRAWLLREAEHVLGTATEIARALSGLGEHVTPSMIRGYAHRRRLATRGTDDAGHPLYRLGDVLALVLDPDKHDHREQQKASKP